ncbi:MAG: leucine--tRNA ligase [Candidatus Daviesbacteria bacterium]|nr:leucine--tRNA ligase [Candidatus Daviesbacteria bacterium]
MYKYEPAKIEPKWQKKWAENQIYKAESTSEKPKKYILDMFPYPSGEGLHVGHFKIYTASDIIARYYRFLGFNVLHPMGWDAFGLPAENYAIRTGIHPAITTAKNISNIKRQMQMVGFSYDWSREVNTTDPNYYKWTQWIFLKLYEKGLAYEDEAPINWCPKDKTGLANEEVKDGKCDRCGTQVEQKRIRQWILRITEYADRLLKDLDALDWPQAILDMQKNWIGKSEDVEIEFPLKDLDKNLSIVTTRPDTIFGVTFMVIAPEHELIEQLKDKIANWEEVSTYTKKASSKTSFERGLATKEKTGVELKGVLAINPVNKKEVPVYISDYVLATYGTGAIMAVPGHDDRDYAFAKKFNLPIVNVINKPEETNIFSIYIYDEDQSDLANQFRKMGKPMEYWTPTQRKYDFNDSDISEVIELLKKSKIGSVKDYDPIKLKNSFAIEIAGSIDFGFVYSGDGVHINSEFLNGLKNQEAILKMQDWLEKEGVGVRSTHYHLRDWIFSRQRYWGEPIPLVHCEKDGVVALDEKDLPLKLPDVEKYEPTGTGESPLASISEWVNTTCPKCGGPAKRETNTMPQWAGSCWYYLRFIDPKNNQHLVDKELEKYWMSVDWYLGGAEHAVLHLLYARFWHKVLFDIGVVSTEEPFKKLSSVGLVLAADGRKMSKSLGNVVTPDDIVKEYSADTLRVFEAFMGPFENAIAWDPSSINGVYHFLQRVWGLQEKVTEGHPDGNQDLYRFRIKSGMTKEDLQIMHKTIKKVTDDVAEIKLNTAVAALMEWLNHLSRKEKISTEEYKTFLILLAPFAPHITEELWESVILGTQSQAWRTPESTHPSKGGKKDAGQASMTGNSSIHQQSWPQSDNKSLKELQINIVVQVNGKMRDLMTIQNDIEMNEKAIEILALQSPKVGKFVKGQVIVKTIYVPGKIINFVVRPS